ncbi:hypothetical protein Goari_009962 [Gossypium aridum]|uniref:Uncharacterized protein n=1 Tax=Gossypium aridum TaxID=34290 RepID=A0A7J8XYJ6_GOSAI|nr:hypothetical protein [Gossypium aridum]
MPWFRRHSKPYLLLEEVRNRQQRKRRPRRLYQNPRFGEHAETGSSSALTQPEASMVAPTFEMELILLLVKIIVTVVLVGVSVMFLRLLDALVLTPKRIRSQLQIQPITQSTPPSSLAPNNTQFKGKQVWLSRHLYSHFSDLVLRFRLRL